MNDGKLQIIRTCLLITGLFSSVVQAELLRINPESILDQLTNNTVTIIDARPLEDYKAGHIKGAISLSEAQTYHEKSTGGRVAGPDVMQKLIQERGIEQNSAVIVYDGGNLLDAARVFWVLEVYGIKSVKLLSPGYEYWIKQSYPVGTDVPVIQPSTYVATINHQRIASKFATQLASADPEQNIIDARFPNAYHGETSSARRHGHIPNAINMPITINIDKSSGVTTLRSHKELQSIYSKLPTEKKVILYCEIGRASSMTYLALRELGYDVANYDASWREWGNDFSLPIEK